MSHLTLDPFPLGDLNLSGNLATHVMTALHGNGELLRLHVGSDVIDLDDPTHEVGVGAADVVGGFFDFFHALSIAWIPADLNRSCASVPTGFFCPSDTNPYQQKYNTTNPYRQPTQSIKQWRTYSLHIRALQYFSQTHEEFAILYNESVSIMM